MAIARIFQRSTDYTTGFLLANPDNISSTGQGPEPSTPTHDIDFSDRKVATGTGLIAGGMALTFLAFFIINYNARKNTKAAFKVIIERDNAVSYGHAIKIEDLGIHRRLSETEQSTIGRIGLRPFLQNIIQEIVAERIKSGKPIQTKLMVQQVASVFYPEDAALEKLNPHDLLEELKVEYQNRRNRCNFFAAVLPPLMQSTILFEVLFGVVQQIGSLQLSSEILPFSKITNNAISITQTGLSTVFELFMIYISPGQAFMRDLGYSIDGSIIRFFNHLFYRNQLDETQAPETQAIQEPRNVKYKKNFAKSVLMIFILNNLLTEILTDYQETISLNDRINAQPDSLIPAWLVFLGSMIEYGLNQLNDPVMLFSEIMMGFTLIDVYFSKKAKSPTPSAPPVVVSDDYHALEQVDVEADDEVVNKKDEKSIWASPHLGHFSPARSARSTSALTAAESPAVEFTTSPAFKPKK